MGVRAEQAKAMLLFKPFHAERAWEVDPRNERQAYSGSELGTVTKQGPNKNDDNLFPARYPLPTPLPLYV